MTTAEKYVTAVYLVVLATVILYVVIYAFKMARLQREVEELAALAAQREQLAESQPPRREPERVS
jgi:cell division protein FtsL